MLNLYYGLLPELLFGCLGGVACRVGMKGLLGGAVFAEAAFTFVWVVLVMTESVAVNPSITSTCVSSFKPV